MLKTIGIPAALAFVSATILLAQSPPRRAGGPRRGGVDELVSASVDRMLLLDADKDGKLSKAEVADQRLAAFFDRGDADHDGVLTKEELTVLFKREAAALHSDAPGAGGSPEFGGLGAAPGFAPSGGFPRPGEVLPRFLQDALQLTADQRAELAKLQADVDARLGKILTQEQRERLNAFGQRGPRGPARPGVGRPPRREE